MDTENSIKLYNREEYSLGMDGLSLSEAVACARVPGHTQKGAQMCAGVEELQIDLQLQLQRSLDVRPIHVFLL